MDNSSEPTLAEVMRRRMPDMSQVKPPKEHAVHPMIRNLRAADGTKTDKSTKHTKRSY